MFKSDVKNVLKHIVSGNKILFIDTSDETSFILEFVKQIKSQGISYKDSYASIFYIDSATQQADTRYDILNNVSINISINFNLTNIFQSLDQIPVDKSSQSKIIFIVADAMNFISDRGGMLQRLIKNFNTSHDKIYNKNLNDRFLFLFLDNSNSIPAFMDDSSIKISVGYPDLSEIQEFVQNFIIAHLNQNGHLAKHIDPIPAYETQFASMTDNQKWEYIKSKVATGNQKIAKIDIKVQHKNSLITIPYIDFTNLFVDDNFFISFCEQLKGLSFMQIKQAINGSIVNMNNNSERTNDNKLYGKIQLKELSDFKVNVNKFLIQHLDNSESSFDSIGGLGNIKKESRLISLKLNPRIKEYNINPYKGMLLVGVPGTGKTEVVKAVANHLNIPLLRLDIGQIFSKYVGESERKIREVLKKLEVMSPNVVLIDEIEKAFGGGGKSDGSNDSGTSSRILMTFLYWMQEKKESSIIIATANDISKLPAEFLRVGRFDSIFFFDFPTQLEREELFRIFIKAKSKFDFTDVNIASLAKNTENYTGSEIRNLIEMVSLDAFESLIKDNKLVKINTGHILDKRKDMNILYNVKKDDIDHMRNWAKTSNITYASNDIMNNKSDEPPLTFKIGSN